jgi:hypothetical protein
VHFRRLVVVAFVAFAACGSRVDGESATSVDDMTASESSESTSTTSTSSTTHATSTDSSPSTDPDGPPATVTATEADVELSLTVESTAVSVGTRLWATLVVKNVGHRTVYWQAGGCSTPGTVVAFPAGDGPSAATPQEGWDGDLVTFPAWVRDHHVSSDVTFSDAPGWRAMLCTAESHMKALAPGEAVDQRVAGDLRLPPGVSGSYTVRAAFRSYASPEDYGGSDADRPRELATVSMPIELRPAGSGLDEAIDAFGRAGALAAFVERTRTATVENTWTTELAWWNGAWELWLTPYYSNGGIQHLRLRHDPVRGEIVDARVVWDGLAPEDDPDATRPSGARPDERV